MEMTERLDLTVLRLLPEGFKGILSGLHTDMCTYFHPDIPTAGVVGTGKGTGSSALGMAWEKEISLGKEP